MEALALIALVVVIMTATLTPRWQAVAAVASAVVLLVVGAVGAGVAGDSLKQLAPVVGFLLAVLVLAASCDRAGLFTAAGDRIARWSLGSPTRLLLGGFSLSALSTIVLSLDTTVVLVTPVALRAARRIDVDPAPVAYATAHLANSSSLLLPVSNLTNLLVLAVVPIGFGRFAALMALPWVVTLAVEWLGLQAVFSKSLGQRRSLQPDGGVRPWPVVPVIVVACTLIGFAGASAINLAVAWPAGIGAAALVVYEQLTASDRPSARTLLASAKLDFAVFATGLAIVVDAVGNHGADHLLRDVLPTGSGWPALLGIAAIATVLSNLVNNLPATLLLLPILAMTAGVSPALAALIGLNVGPNLTYPGSLATMLWRRQVGSIAVLSRWTVLGFATVPVAIVGAVTGLWLVT